MSETEVYTKIEKFSGLKQDWRLWSDILEAKMISKDQWEVIDMKPDDVPSSPDTEEDKKVIKKNMKAYSDLISSIDMKTPQGRIAMNLIVSSKSATYPNGNCSRAWKKLTRKYEPVTIAELTREKTNYINFKFLHGGDPDSFIDIMERKVSRLSELGYTIPTRDLIIDIISRLPSDYDIIIEKVNDKLDAEEDPEDILEFARERLRAKFERLNPYKSRRKGNAENFKEVDKALYLGATKIVCFRCGVSGHRSNKCPGSNEVCSTCGKRGHMQNVCQDNPRRITLNTNWQGTPNQHPGRPNPSGSTSYQSRNYQNKSQNGNNANQTRSQENQDSMKRQMDQAEIILAALVLQNHEDKIPHHWWMADTGASSHMVRSKHFLMEIEPCNVPIQVGNGEKVIAKEKGTIKLQVDNGDQGLTITLKNVLYVPELIINIISLTKVIDLGFEVISDRKQIAIKHGKNIIRFDKRLLTTTGHVQYFEAIPLSTKEGQNTRRYYNEGRNKTQETKLKKKKKTKSMLLLPKVHHLILRKFIAFLDMLMKRFAKIPQLTMDGT